MERSGYFGTTVYTEKQRESTSSVLKQMLGPEYLSERQGPGNSKLKYIDAGTLINLANEVFDFNGWSHSIVSQTVDFLDELNGKYSVGVSTIVRVTLKDGTFHEDLGYGCMENCRQRAAALEKAKKESVTDALKRALRHFGNSLGNCVYSKDYLKSVSRVKNPPKSSMDPKSLYRQPHLRTIDSNINSAAPSRSASDESLSTSHVGKKAKIQETPPVKVEDELLSDFDDELILAADIECIETSLLMEGLPFNQESSHQFIPPSTSIAKLPEPNLHPPPAVTIKPIEKSSANARLKGTGSVHTKMTQLNDASNRPNNAVKKWNGAPRPVVPPCQRQFRKAYSTPNVSVSDPSEIPGFT